MYFLISILMFLVPLFIWPGWSEGIRTPKEFLSILGFMAIIGWCITRYRLKPFNNKWLVLFWLWCFITVLCNSRIFPIYLNQVVIDMPSILFMWKELFYISIAIFTIYCISSSEIFEKDIKFLNITIKFDQNNNLRTIARSVAWCVIVMSIYSIYQAIGLDEFFRVSNLQGWVASSPIGSAWDTIGSFTHRIVGTCGNPKVLSLWLVIMAPLCLYLKNKLGITSFTLCLVSIMLTGSATGVIGLGVALFVYLYFNSKKVLLAILILCIPIVFLFSYHYYDKISSFFQPKGRIEVHREAFNLLKEKSITGLGLGSFEYLIGNDPQVVERLDKQNWKELHDEYGQLWFSVGIVGLMFFVGFLISTVRRFFKNITEESIVLFSSLSALFVMSFTYFTMRVAPSSFCGVIITGLLLRQIGERNA